MPVTFATMTVGLAALAGLPPFAGFFSKEAVLGAAEETGAPRRSGRGLDRLAGARRRPGDRRGHRGLRHPALADDVLRRRRAAASPAHESPPAMRWPLVVLAVPPTLLGLVGLRSAGCRSGWLDGHRAAGPGAARRAGHVACSRSLLAAGRRRRGAGVAGGATRRPTRRGARPARRPLVHAFCVDDLYDRLFVRPVAARRAGRRAGPTTRSCVGAVRGTGRGARGWPALLRADPERQRADATSPACSPGVVLIVAGVVVLT